jgi:hypothetical protein
MKTAFRRRIGAFYVVVATVQISNYFLSDLRLMVDLDL